MKIKEIRIYGYGKLENVVIKNLDTLTVFYGENEAGKSTIMSFIHSILFGFPTKQQTELQRYEPKFHSKYGGMLIIEFPEIGIVSIERVKGKATGDVTVTLPDGTTGEENVLKELLYNMDRQTFRSIYSFNIHEIQDVQKLDNSDMNRFLFSSGAVGTDKLMTVETILQKELEDRFKRRGQKPLLNVLLTDIRKSDEQLRKAKQNNEQYFIFMKEKDTLENQFKQLKQQQDQLNEEKQVLEQWKKLHPTVQEKTTIQTELSQIGEVPFPIDGQNRLEQLQQLLVPLETQIAGKQERLKLLVNDLEKNKPNQLILQRDAEISWINETISLYERLKHEENEQKKTITYIKEEMEILCDQFHLQIDQQKLTNTNTSMVVKEEVETLDREMERLKDKKRELDDRFEEEKQKLTLLEAEKQQLETNMLSADDRQQLEEQVSASENRQFIEREYHEVTEKLTQLLKIAKEKEHQDKKLRKKDRIQTFFLGGIFLILAIFSFIHDQVFIGIAALTGLVFLLWMKRNDQLDYTDTNVKWEIDQYKKRQQLLADELAKGNNVNIKSIQQQLASDNQLRERHTYINLNLKRQLEDYETVITHYEQWEADSKLLKQACHKFADEWGVTKEIVETHLLTLFEALDQLKKLQRTYEQTNAQLQILVNKITEIEKRANQLAIDCQLNTESSIYQIAVELKRQRENEREKQISFHEKQMKHAELEEDLKQLIAEKNNLLLEINILYDEANVENLDQFYAVGEKVLRIKSLRAQLIELERSIDENILEKARNLLHDISTNGEEKLQHCSIRMNEIDDQMMDIQARLAEVKHQIHLLEEGGTYAEHLHRFKQQQAEFNEEAKNWARYAIAKDLLIKTMNRFKQDKLPKVLLTAGTYLQRLTVGEYQTILFNETDGFLIERNDYVKFQPKELSQATAEQVYVALRFALATTVGEQSHRYPIIIDDSFVNFDESRVKQTLELLQEISKEYQILFFTCHTHLLTQFQAEQIIRLPKRSEGQTLELGYNEATV